MRKPSTLNSQAFRHVVHLFPDQTILELGCGEGLFTRALLAVSAYQAAAATMLASEA